MSSYSLCHILLLLCIVPLVKSATTTTKDAITAELEDMMEDNIGQSNSAFANTIYNYLVQKYGSYYFLVVTWDEDSSYNAIGNQIFLSDTKRHLFVSYVKKTSATGNYGGVSDNAIDEVKDQNVCRFNIISLKMISYPNILFTT